MVSCLFVGFMTPRFRNLAIRNKIFDTPNSAHKTHVEPVPYLGGVAIVLGVVLITLIVTLISDLNSLSLAAGILLPSLFLSCVGLIDDLRNLSPLPRFLAQSLVGIVVALILIQSETIGAPTGFKILDIIITITFIVGLSNSINFFDNIDGGASGSVAISSFILSILAYSSKQHLLAGISIVISGATIGFLWWNKSPARIYMGDAGSLFLGSILAAILIRFDPIPSTYPIYFFVPLFLIAVPLLDTCTVIISRVLRKTSPFIGGRDHLSHRLMRFGVSKVRAVSILWALTLIFCLIAILLSSANLKLQVLSLCFGSSLWMLLLLFFLWLPAI